jgi:hypothetical protein
MGSRKSEVLQPRRLLNEGQVDDLRSIPLAHDALSPVENHLMEDWNFVTHQWCYQAGLNAVA